MKQSKTRFPVLVTCLLALLAPAWVFALNLGDIHLKSEPGEPLEAEIPLSDVSAAEQDSLSVGLADVAGFRWAGIEWSPALNRLQFELERGAGGAHYIRVHSDGAVRAPVLRFLLKVAWSRGRLFREYTLELDAPPPDSGVAPAYPAAPEADDGRQEIRAAVKDSRKYEIRPDDTLWEIARALRPDSSVSIQQMMLALLRTNPDAFINGNINRLKRSAELWLPSEFELQALSAAEAFAEVLVQNNVWRAARGLPTVDSGWLAGAGTIAVDGGLRLVPVTEGDLEDDDISAAEPGGASREQPLALANEQVEELTQANALLAATGDKLALANEQVEELAQENVELEGKLTEAGTIIEDLKRLVELKDDELAALQGQSIGEDADPGPGLPERLRSFHDATIKPAYNLARDNWYIVLAGLALLLVGWLLLRRKATRAPKGFSVPTASVRADFVAALSNKKTVSPAEDTGVRMAWDPATLSNKKTVSPAEDDVDENGADGGELDFADDMQDVEEDSTGSAEVGEPEVPDQETGHDEERADAEQADAEQADTEQADTEQADTEQADAGQAHTEQEDEDLVQNKLDLARAYLELGDAENVRSILSEVLAEGNAAQREEARQLLEQANSG